MPWGPELAVFAQNTARVTLFAPGTEVVLHWNPAHTFVLDAAQDADAGVETVESGD